MPVSRIGLSLLTAALAWSQPATAQDFTTTIKPKDGWQALHINLREIGEVMLILKPVAHQGRVAICGVVMPRKSTMDRYIHDLVQGTRIRLGPAHLVPNPDHFPIFRPAGPETLAGKTAGCTLTRAAASPDLMRQGLTLEMRGTPIPDW